MNFELSEQEQDFRGSLRQWLEDHLPEGWGETVFEPVDLHEKIAFLKDWSRKLHEAGYAGLNWPKEYGGAGATFAAGTAEIQRNIIAECVLGLPKG